jgi:hypothetical protein
MTAPLSTSDFLPFPRGARAVTLDVPQIRGRPAYAEIKPHNIKGIRAGLVDLARNRPRLPGEAYLLTYRYTRKGPMQVWAYLLKPHDGIATDPAFLPRRGVPLQDWVDRLGRWWTLLDGVRGPDYSIEKWRDKVGGTVFGSMLEPFLRESFFAKTRTTEVNAGHLPNKPGADLRWQEIAEFFYELSGELAELAASDRR